MALAETCVPSIIPLIKADVGKIGRLRKRDTVAYAFGILFYLKWVKRE